MKELRGIILLCTSYVLTGCATLPPCTDLYSDAEERGTVVVYRPARVMGFAVSQKISVGECSIGSLKNGKYVAGNLPPGEYSILAEAALGEDLASAQFQIEAEQKTYFRWSEEVDSVYVVGAAAGAVGSTNFVLVPEVTALEEMPALRDLD